MAIGPRVKAVRNYYHMTQRELAGRLSISSGYLSDVENGKNKINADIIAGIILHFPKISPGWLLVGRGDMIIPESDVVSDYSLDINALSAAEEIFSLAVRHTHDSEKRRCLFRDQGKLFNLIYSVYMTHLHALRAQGTGEAEAHSLSRNECDRLGANIAGGDLGDFDLSPPRSSRRDPSDSSP